MSIATTPSKPSAHPPMQGLPRVQPQQIALAAMLVVELVVFSIIGENFCTLNNFFDVLRLTVEVGLLSLAMTPVIATGGIDLSVGSLLALTAIIMGMLWKEFHFPLWLAATIGIGVGAVGGALNGAIITRLRVPPLIVTLGSMSLFRGLAEGITGGSKNYTDFPAGFVFLGRGNIGPIPTQAPLFLLAAIGFWILLHRSTVGRALSAIGYSPDARRYAGIPVERRVALTYILSGLAAGVAGILYAAHYNQAKSDAGMGYELEAITAVVLGGTSIFGGRGTVIGTLMGLFSIALLKNGLLMARLPPEIVDAVSELIHALPKWLGGKMLAEGASISSNLPSELAGILTGFLLLGAIAVDRSGRRQGTAAPQSHNEESEMKNAQLAVLSIVILIAAALIAGTNFLLVRAIQDASVHEKPHKKLVIAMMPKSKGNGYFISCRKGAEAAAKDLGVELLWDGPTDTDAARQSEVVEAWITKGVDVIAVACENGKGISEVLKKARAKGIKVVTWDADSNEDARDFFVTQAMPDDMGRTLLENAAKVMGGKGEFAIITASLSAANMNAWEAAIEKYRAKDFPDMKRVTTEVCNDDQETAKKKASAILNSYPNLKVILAICSPAGPGTAEAVKLSKRTDVKVVAVSLPNDNRDYVHAGITDDLVLWKTYDLGYLTVQAAVDLHTGKLKPGDKVFDAGKVGTKKIEGTNIILGKPFTFTKDNIDQFDF